MKTTVVYIYPLAGRNGFGERADRFVDSYRRNPPGLAHDTVIVCNGAGPCESTRSRFRPLPGLRFVEHDNRGMDIGGFLAAANGSDADIMVFFGSNTYFRKPEWLVPVHRSWFRHGDTLYGATGHRGEGHIHPHIRTTGFWMRPGLLTRYCPKGIGNERRYEFEHGSTCLTNWIKSQGMTPWVVSWTAEHLLHQCHGIPNGYRIGNQENVIFGDRLTEPPNHDDPLA